MARDTVPMRLRRLLTSDPLLLALLPLGLFLLFYRLPMLDVRNIGWLLRGSDNGENALGLHAWLRDPQAGAFSTGLLNAPDGVALLFTDSNPLLAWVARPFALAIGGDVQVVGLWYLLCLVLHVFLARSLLKPYAPTHAALWFGVTLLTLLPTLWVRQIHANLYAHWLILWALWIFVEPRRAGDARWWAAALSVTALIHNYLLVMVAAIWASAMLERFATAGGMRERVRVVGSAALVLAAVLVILWALGVRGGLVSSDTYGRFGMPLDAPWNPAIPAMSTLLPATAQAADRQLEAFQYLGAGLLLLIVATPLLLWRSAAADEARGDLHRRLFWLVPASIVLTALAVSNRVDMAGRTLMTLPLSDFVSALLDPLRASSRLFWPVAYAAVFAAVAAAYRLGRERASRLLLAALAVQAIDLIGLVGWTRAETSGALVSERWVRTRDPRWDAAIRAARDVTIMPPDAIRQLDLFQEVAWRSVSAGKPVRHVYAARDGQATLDRLDAERRDFMAGRIEPDRLYVLLPEAAIPAAAAARAATLDGVRVLLPVGAVRPARADATVRHPFTSAG